MSRQDKKERNRLKRKRKQQELRKKRNASVFQTLAHKEGPVECFINSNWHESGEANIMVLRPVPGGSNIFVAFLVDLWCCGLKDAFGRLNVARGDFEEHLENPNIDFEMIPLDFITAQRLVAGGMRLCVENGFRLPHKASRWASIIGVASYADADLSDFPKPNGKYRYVGSINDLRKRLVGSVNDFLARSDVEFVLEDSRISNWADEFEDEEDYEEDFDEESFDDEDDETTEMEMPDIKTFRLLMQSMAEIRERAVKMIEDWVESKGQTPHIYLKDAFMLTLTAALGEGSKRDNEQFSESILVEYMRDHADPQGLTDAMKQLVEFNNSDNNRSRLRELIKSESATQITEIQRAAELLPSDSPPQ